MASELRQMPLEEVAKRLQNDVGSNYSILVRKRADGHVVITTTRKTA